MLLNHNIQINEVFSFDSINQNHLKKLALEVIDCMSENEYLINDYFSEYYIDENSLPPSVIDMIAQDLGRDVHDLTSYDIFTHKYAEKYMVKFITNLFKIEYNSLNKLPNPCTLYRYIDLYNEANNIKYKGEDLLNHILDRNNIHLGTCWTPNFDKAMEFGKDNFVSLDEGIIMEIETSKDSIDLPRTLILRNGYTYYHYEDEIRLVKGSPVNLKTIYKLDNDNTSWLKMDVNQKYYA